MGRVRGDRRASEPLDAGGAGGRARHSRFVRVCAYVCVRERGRMSSILGGVGERWAKAGEEGWRTFVEGGTRKETGVLRVRLRLGSLHTPYRDRDRVDKKILFFPFHAYHARPRGSRYVGSYMMTKYPVRWLYFSRRRTS